MRILIAIFILYASGQLSGQDHDFKAPDYKKIEKNTHKKSSEYFYPTLLERFHSYDSTLKLDDYRHLYYGYIFQDGFKAYWSSPVSDELQVFSNSQSINEKDYDTIIKLINISLADFPFDLRNMNFKAYLYHKNGDDEMANKIMMQYNAIINAIISTGDGKTCENSIHVISVGHEYLLLNIFELQLTQQSLIGECDYMQVAEGNHNIEGVYFNVGKILEAQSKIFK